MDPAKYLTVVAEEASLPRDELYDDTEFADIGIDAILARAITDRFAKETPRWTPPSVFAAFPDVQSFVQYVKQTAESKLSSSAW